MATDGSGELSNRPFELAMAQMSVRGGDLPGNLSRASRRIRAAAEHGASLVLLPEALDVGWTHPAGRELAGAIPEGAACQALARAAREHGLYVCAGITERQGEAIYNAAVLIDPAGRVILHHRKLNELEIGHDLYAPGDRLAVARTELGTLGLMICADAFARGQVISRALGLMGADMILSPCAWAVPADHDQAQDPYGKLWLDHYGPVARDFRMWIAGTSNVGPIDAGPWAGRRCIGCSLLVGPDGRPARMGRYGVEADEILYHQILLTDRPARGCGWEHLWTGTP